MNSDAAAEAPASARRRWHDRHRWHRARHRLRHSVKGRLVLLFVLVGVCTAVVFLYGTQRALQGGWQAFARPLLADYVDRLATEVGSPPSQARAQALAERLPIRVRIEGPTVRFDTHPEDAARDDARKAWRRWADGERTFDAEDWGLTRPTADGHRLLFSLARPPESWRARGIGWVTLGTLLVLTLLAYAAVRRLLRPLEDITVAVERYGRGEFGQPIAVRRHDELGDLATRINHMASSLHGMLEAKRGLLLAISHELRSPLTRARLNAELLGESAEREALLRDLGEMRELITGLLESERLGDGHAALQREPTDLAALARELKASAFAGSDLDLNLDLELDLDEHLGAVDVDPMRLRLLLRNLVDNARRHGGAARAPTLFLRREVDGDGAGPPEGVAWAIGVRDFGPGVTDEQLGRLGEAFYRPDSARTRAAGGVGLGLHLCRLIARAHGGELRLRNVHPGLEVAMVWRPAPQSPSGTKA